MQKTADIAICGAGPTGQALALFLIKKGIAKSDLVLIDAKSKEQSKADKRTIALSFGSQQLLQSIDAAPIKSTEIHQIHVSRSGHFGRTLIDRTQHQVAALGYVARYADIVTPLSDALDKQGQELTFLRPGKVIDITQTETLVQIQLDDLRSIHAQIFVQAEGGLFNEQNPQTKHHDYQQSAIITSIKASKPIAARAYERFTDQGPLALLPQEDGYAVVWCVSPDVAEHLLTLDDAAFLAALQSAFGERLGQFSQPTPRSVFALGLNAQTSAPTGRVICIGNAAQTLHPVAGQGLNLGLRDAVQLAQFLSRSISPDALQDFFRERSADRNRTIQLTDRLAQLFTKSATRSVPAHAVQSLLSGGLGLMDIFPPARHWLAEQMMFGKR
jgi:2-octaprenyl-6-methoxyphenol hydroxylase